MLQHPNQQFRQLLEDLHISDYTFEEIRNILQDEPAREICDWPEGVGPNTAPLADGVSMGFAAPFLAPFPAPNSAPSQSKERGKKGKVYIYGIVCLIPGTSEYMNGPVPHAQVPTEVHPFLVFCR